MDQELQNEREKHDISRLKGLYQILRVKNREKLAKIKQVGSFCRINLKWSQKTLNRHTHMSHEVSTVNSRAHARRALIKRMRLLRDINDHVIKIRPLDDQSPPH